MKKLMVAILLLGFILPGTVLALDYLETDQSKYIDTPGFLGFVPDRFIVVLKDNVAVDHGKDLNRSVALSNLSGFDALAQKYEVESLRPQFPGADRNSVSLTAEAQDISRHYKVYIQSGTLEEAMADYAALPDVERVEPIGVHVLYSTPNDPYYVDPPSGYAYDQWHYWDTYGMNADSAWDKEAGDNTVLVGVLDMGAKYDHIDLGGSNPPGPNDASTNGNIWVNTNEIPGNGVDDDGNGYVDDIIGWDFVESTDWYSYPCVDLDCGGADNDPWDGDGHGTHVSGTIGAITNNGYAVSGVAGGWGDGTYTGGGNGVKIVPCRIGYVLDYWIYGNVGVVIMDYVAEAMYYMAELKIDGWNVAAINCSFGNSNSGGLAAATDYLLAQDVMVISAAGNSDADDPSYLGTRADCLDVGATDSQGNPADFSTYGSWVDIAAPGVAVLSTITDPANPTVDYVAPLDGTSMSCPHVVGVAALLESFNPALSGPDKFAIITDAANTKSYNQTKYVGVGIVDAGKCLNAAGPECDLAADFSGSPTSGCAPLTVDFTDQSSGTGIDGWSWTFGDGGNSSAQNPSYTYNTPGTYTVSLTVSSSSQGCDDTQTKTGYITVNGGPTANFEGSPTSGTEPLTVNFTDLSADATGWSWDFGDGAGSSTEQNPSYTYNSAGTYTVILTASNACGSDVEHKVDYITVNPCVAPVADFVGSPTSGEVPLQVSFTDQSSGNPTSWSWDFGDGTGTSTQQNPSYTYNDAGTYTVTLTATNSCGSDVETKVDYITVTCTAPVADFSGTPTAGNAPLTVNFTDLSTGATGWSWDFGDGLGTSTQQNPSYTYNDPGTYTVTLTATNSCGSDQAVKLDYITVTESQFTKAYPLSDIPVYGTVSGSYLDTYSSDNVYETITEIQYTGHPVKTYSYLEHKWNFNIDASSGATFYLEAYRPDNSDGDDFTFAYSTDDVNYYNLATVASATEQVYTASLPAITGVVYIRVLDSQRGWGTNSLDPVYVDEMYIEYSSAPAPPTANFSGNPTSGFAPLTVQFTDMSTGSPTSWSWDFGDGVGTSTVQNPSYTYNNPGTYTVSMTATNDYGSDTETKVDYIIVTEQGTDYCFVYDMTVSRKTAGPNCSGQCWATIYNSSGQPLANATVYLSATGPVGGAYSALTGADGVAFVETGKTKECAGEWCFEVTDVTHATYPYDAGANNVTSACESGWVYDVDGIASASRQIPDQFTLEQNRPNPFNPVTEIAFNLPQGSQVKLEIFNITGQRVAVLANGYYDAGRYSVTWNAVGQTSGIYFYRIVTDSFTESKKMILLK
ncbi:MAG TPA: PKD domain-containing protein [candidate division Zixibacteria bacterium]|nr:PKD domain-containing protein [candidate division Zixibacteria bacterium]